MCPAPYASQGFADSLNSVMTELGIGALSVLAVGSLGQMGVVTVCIGVSLLHWLVVGADAGELKSGQAKTLHELSLFSPSLLAVPVNPVYLAKVTGSCSVS